MYEAFSEYQLPELLRTPLNSLCLQIKSLQVESIAGFLSAALQAPEPLTVSDRKMPFLDLTSCLVLLESLHIEDMTLYGSRLVQITVNFLIGSKCYWISENDRSTG